MQCPVCGYQMTAFEVECPRCERMRASNLTSSGAHTAPGAQPAVPARRTPMDASHRRLVVAGVVVGLVVLMCVLEAIRQTGMDREERARLAREEQERHRRIAAVLGSLSQAYPKARFAIYSGDGASTVFNADLALCGVSHVVITRENGIAKVSVGLTGTRSVATAPDVYVSLFDERGVMLARRAIVSYVFKTLEPGQRTSVDDTLDVADSVQPVIVGIDEGDRPEKEQMSAASTAAGRSSSTWMDVPGAAHRDLFMKSLDVAGVGNTFVVAVTRGSSESDLRIYVADEWHAAPFQSRLMAAQTLWKLWASIRSPSDPDHAFISLVDRHGNPVGGSSFLGGSVVHVDR